MIQVSEAAAKEIKRLQSSRNQENSILQIGVKTGGCSGLVYTLELKENLESEGRDYQINDISIKLDAASSDSIKGLKIDYSEDLMGGSFRFQNPNASSVCSCGQSFATEA
ncbi:MAG: iron-sulfur cluster assembly accessory protein [Gomphosphaeria aponina SAG 52.96 = DSM 107014]|uniref:Iron-sulfur cluster assembly accessory protein n=1 Tax=Gomphosphaeria aponina SAG 52.96 = DSM 107014 TaxID=1521640 RepID=A0A941GUZ1_9CHRO|nr:iron-sulfur cluster assembly accessory protein [Gomphosphaeria aponina SAG 52.96 = DSM 107014]